MTWLTTNSAPSIQNFQEAEYYYNNFKPIRGRTIEETGAALGHRRDWRHKSLHKIDKDTYGFRLYSTDVVKIHRDNSIALDLSYPSATTDKWAEHWLWVLTGHWISVASQHMMITLSDRWVDDDTLKQYRYEVREADQRNTLQFFTDDYMFRLEPHYRKRWEKIFVKDPAIRYVKLVDKSAATDSRKPLQPFINYLKIFEGTPLPNEAIDEMGREFRDAYGSSKSALKMVAEHPDQQELWAFAAAECHHSEYNWRGQRHDYKLLPLKQIKTAVYQYRYEIDDLHGFKPLPIGVCKNTMLYTQSYIERNV
jgi:hypothetical protein